jgi:hypothetical protein
MSRHARATLVVAALLVVSCSRPGFTLQPYTSERFGFTIATPSTWTRVETQEGQRQWFLPAAPEGSALPETTAAEFIVVMSLDEPGPLSESDVRRLAMSLLPMHGVSGFQRMATSTAEVTWYRFELTGSTRGQEWASVGLLVSGPRRLHYVVCAAPLSAWRARQKTCDDVLRSFIPGLQTP